MMRIVIGLFEPEDVFVAARRLMESSDLTSEDMSLLSSASEMPAEMEGEPEEAAASGATIGAATGSSVGALSTLVASTIPGLEAMFVSGMMATAAGGLIGGYLGSLYSVRAESQTKIDIKDQLAAGQLLLVVKTGESESAKVKSILEANQGEHVEIHEISQD
jgi:hypothetical protein